MSTHQRLQKLFIQVLELSSEENVEDIKYRDTKSWDSVGHMRLVAAIETEFGIFMETEQILDMSTFDIALGIVKAHGISD
jgi:acyl carrier protein